MDKTISNSWQNMVIIGILVLILGVVAIIWPEDTLKLFLIIAGLFAIISGIAITYDAYVSENKFNTVIGVLCIVLGIIFVILPNFMADVLVYLAAIFFIIFGVIQIIDGNSLSQDYTDNRYISAMIGVLLIILGIIIAIYNDATIKIVMIVIGAFLIVSAVLYIFNGLKLRCGLKV
jgi:uncharacterized membrane protein HdeD (DUF308 family)